MRVKTELANKLKSSAETNTASTVVGSSFKETFHSKASAPTHGLVEYSYRARQQREQQQAQGSAQFTRHANIGKAQRKNITVEEASRLAKYAPTIRECSKKYGVPVELVCAVILQESSAKPRAVSVAGAKGLMQLMPGTARRFGVTDSFNPTQNIEGGTRYLRFLLERFKGDVRLALAGYNAGEANVEKYGNKIPPFAETQNYVPKVLAYADTIWNMLREQPQVATTNANLPLNARKV